MAGIDLYSLKQGIQNVNLNANTEGEKDKIDAGTEATEFLNGILKASGITLPETSQLFKELSTQLVGLTKDQALAMMYTLLSKMDQKTKADNDTTNDFDGSLSEDSFGKLLATTLGKDDAGGTSSYSGTDGLCATGEGELKKLHDIFAQAKTVTLTGEDTEQPKQDKKEVKKDNKSSTPLMDDASPDDATRDDDSITIKGEGISADRINSIFNDNVTAKKSAPKAVGTATITATAVSAAKAA